MTRQALIGKGWPHSGLSGVGVRAEDRSHTGVVKRQERDRADKVSYLAVVG